MKKTIFLFAILFSLNLFSQEKPQSEKMLAEIQLMRQSATNLKLVWWIPTEYWGIAMREQQAVTPDQIEYIENLLNDYTIIAAGDYSLSPQHNTIEFKVIDIKKGVEFYNSDHKKISALKNSQIKKEVVVIINDMMKPLFTQMLGKTGTGVEFFIYNNKDMAGNRILDPNKPGSFKIEVNKETFQFNLPLVSLMKEKVCKNDSTKFPGNYVYCPFHGTEL